MQRSDDLSRTLDEMFLAIRAGRFDALDLAVRQLEAGEGHLEAADAAALSSIRRKAELNTRCLAAALRGVRAARRRIDEIASIHKGTSTYDCNGRRDETRGTPGRLVERF